MGEDCSSVAPIEIRCIKSVAPMLSPSRSRSHWQVQVAQSSRVRVAPAVFRSNALLRLIASRQVLHRICTSGSARSRSAKWNVSGFQGWVTITFWPGNEGGPRGAFQPSPQTPIRHRRRPPGQADGSSGVQASSKGDSKLQWPI